MSRFVQSVIIKNHKHFLKENLALSIKRDPVNRG